MHLSSRYYVAALMILSLNPASFGQTRQKVSSEILPAALPRFAGTFSPKLGWQEETPSQQARSGSYLVVNNGRLSNYYSVPGKNQEWVDLNRLYDRNIDHSEQVNGLSYTYCSTNTNPNGMSEIITIYDEAIYCQGPVNWPIADCSYGISNLPGAVNGQLACWTVAVDLWGVECNLTSDPNQPRRMGWGQVWDNSDTGPWIASGGYGQVDNFTWFDWNVPAANAFQGCYGGWGVPWSGFHMQMFGGPPDTNRYWAEDLGGTSTNLDGGNVLVNPTQHVQLPLGPTSQTYKIHAAGMNFYTQAAGFSNGVFVGFSNGLRHQNL
jgi:hypothetical protein